MIGLIRAGFSHESRKGATFCQNGCWTHEAMRGGGRSLDLLESSKL